MLSFLKGLPKEEGAKLLRSAPQGTSELKRILASAMGSFHSQSFQSTGENSGQSQRCISSSWLCLSGKSWVLGSELGNPSLGQASDGFDSLPVSQEPSVTSFGHQAL